MTTRRSAQRLLAALLPFAFAAAAASAQEPSDRPRRDPRDRAPQAAQERRFEYEVRLNALRFLNFFQAPEGTPEEDVDARAAELRFRAPLGETLQGYLHADYTDYDDLEASQGLTAGLRSEGERQGFDFYAEALRNRPSFDIGDRVEQADIGRLAGEYSYRFTADWQVSGTVDFEQQRFDVTEGRDNEYLGAGAFLRYRGLGSAFSPEVGAVAGERDAEDPNEDHTQRDLFVKVRSAPTRALYLTGRYRHRTREYGVESPLAGNFERDDTRQQLVLTADLKTGEILTWNLYWSYEDADSTNPTRDFTAQLVALGVSVGVGELFGW
ncbi:MAG TPA: hypothetical protein VF121_08495 [Thermoanaerobaculia bacterium]|nr:hypothetical protein [Thermoanaerobaculia bacterium]